MVRFAARPLTRLGFRRDVRLFLTALFGFLFFVVLFLLFLLQYSIQRYSERAYEERTTVTKVVAETVAQAGPGASDISAAAVYARGKYPVTALEVWPPAHDAMLFGTPSPGDDAVSDSTRGYRVRCWFDTAEIRRMRSLFLATAAVSLATGLVGSLLLLVYARKITAPIEALLDEAREVSTQNEQLDEAKYLIDTFRTTIATLRSQEAELKRLHDIERQQVASRIRELQSLADLGEMSAGIAHEFRNSLGTILGYLRLAARQPDLASAHTRIQAAETEAHALSRAIDGLLSFARTAPLQLESVELRPILDRIGTHLSESSGVPVRIHGDATPFPGDMALLSRAFENLLRNAVEAVREAESEEPVDVEIKDGDPVRVVISDRGAGFNPEDTGKLMLPFHSTKSEGLGLGLPLARKIVLMHGGELTLERQEGLTLAALSIPRSAPDTAPSPTN